ncbi:isoprenoid biosynthesis glyoxalase ElbB [Halobacteriovorax sp. JY17]|uniref:isoprenoid biosynthesis glyoxalase ElbB n=1 Tax=Halobacteriovorax sp. JY17 TaxID=2014617 RepID=UPI000C5CBDEB|nr:isoprenoid biosynthesis glyoxalase ElbB [Halobacteriovorax sp. JY17]PIK15166.1 MAG: isoprenoid biosynthesis protein ElbB [Halobacteriovorax sp. JY17]
MSKKYAVILSGCGYLDGAEIREAVLTLLALDTHGASYEIFAPNEKQFHTINHLEGSEVKQERNILEEAARIARGKISPLKDLDSREFSGLLIPGGFGVAKNLCDFAFKGSGAKANSIISGIITDFFAAKKPIGAICIAPALVSLVLGEHSIEVTIGTDEGTAAEIEKTGAKHINCTESEFHLDIENKIATTPAYMFDDNKLHLVQQGIYGVVESVIKWS